MVEAPQNRRILIVDDQKDIHDDFEEMLGGSSSGSMTAELASAFLDEDDPDQGEIDFELHHMMRGSDAVEAVSAAGASGEPFAVAYVDVRMPPGIDGIETVRRIRRIDRDLEIVVMTAYTDKPLSDIGRDIDLLHKLLYIRKPFAREEIQQIALSLTVKWNVEQRLAAKEVENWGVRNEMRRLRAELDAIAADREGRIEPLAELERRAVLRAVDVCGNNISRAAAALGISRSALRRKLAAFRETR